MTTPQNGDTGICEVCGFCIDYYYGWRHTNGEAEHRHRAWPKQTSAPALVDDRYTGLVKFIAPEGAIYAWW